MILFRLYYEHDTYMYTSFLLRFDPSAPICCDSFSCMKSIQFSVPSDFLPAHSQRVRIITISFAVIHTTYNAEMLIVPFFKLHIKEVSSVRAPEGLSESCVCVCLSLCVCIMQMHQSHQGNFLNNFI